MALDEFWDWLQNTDLAFEIGATWWFPLLESIHVISIALVVGSIMTVDLRLIGVTARSYALRRISRELIPWAWIGFVIATITGSGMFISRPGAYAANPAFQTKLVLLALAGINVAAFHSRVMRNVDQWDSDSTPPGGAKAAGAVSLALWVGVVLAGRWTGHLN